MFWVIAIGQLNCEPLCPLTVSAFCLFEADIAHSKWLLWHSSQPYHLEQFA